MYRQYISMLATGLLLLGLSGISIAEEKKEPRLYNVEVIVFSQTLGNNTNEHWLQTASDEKLDDDFNPPPVKPLNKVHMLDKSQFELGRIAYTLNRKNNAYRLLSHKKWQQPMFKNTGHFPVSYDINTANGHLSGTIEITAQRFLHANINLLLQREQTLIPFIDKRKMRRDEIHYIDHPLLGIIIKTSRVDEEEQE